MSTKNEVCSSKNCRYTARPHSPSTNVPNFAEGSLENLYFHHANSRRPTMTSFRFRRHDHTEFLSRPVAQRKPDAVPLRRIRIQAAVFAPDVVLEVLGKHYFLLLSGNGIEQEKHLGL